MCAAWRPPPFLILLRSSSRTTQLLGRKDQVQRIALSMLPRELVIGKFVALNTLSSELNKRTPLQMHVFVNEWHGEGEVRPACSSKVQGVRPAALAVRLACSK